MTPAPGRDTRAGQAYDIDLLQTALAFRAHGGFELLDAASVIHTRRGPAR